jgi:ribonuclease J
VTKRTLRVIPLGGLGAIGKNMLVLEYDESLLVVDTGLMFPDDEMLGIDLVLPDFSYVVENQERVLGIMLTHGHEDHIGALPYLLKQIDVPVYGTRFTLALLNSKLGEHGLQGKVNLNEVSTEKDVSLGPFRVEFLEVSHSIRRESWSIPATSSLTRHPSTTDPRRCRDSRSLGARACCC